ncbi:Uncharacterized protein HZ326_10961 [Fusarium oxysporum f. sp. albedinis]|nr:Uncharacterized protein HZ326_10961 [Fusarium oxysporum f. sp. albedinis]
MYSQAQEQLAITVAVWDLAKIRNLLVFDALVDIEANRVRLIYFRPVVLSFGCRYNRLLCFEVGLVEPGMIKNLVN